MTSLFRANKTALLSSIGMAALVGVTATPAAAELKVTVTIKPIHALVAEIMQGVGTPALLVSGAASPHTYALKPSDAETLNRSDIFFRVSESVEPFTARIVRALPDHVRVVTLADAPGVQHLQRRTGATFERHVHESPVGESTAPNHDKDHDHGNADHDEPDGDASSHDQDHDHDSSSDGHVWLDPANAKRMVAEIADVLAEASPADAPVLRRNAARVAAEIDTLDSDIARDLAPIKGKPFVVFHDAYQYFERRFGLNAVGSVTVSPEVQPSAKRLTEIRQKITSLGASCVFAEPQFQPRLVDAVIEGTAAHAGTLDPEGALVAPGAGGYTTLLKNLASGLKSCLIQGS